MSKSHIFLNCFSSFCLVFATLISCNPIEENIPIESIAINLENAEVEIGKAIQLSVSISPSNSTNKSVTWSSSNTSIATVNNSGLVLGVAEGQSTITASADGKRSSCSITVSKPFSPVESLSLDKKELSIDEGATETLTATVKPDDATDKTVTWTSSDEKVATVDDGVVTALKEGTATITAKAGGKTATCAVTVSKRVIPVESITLNKSSLTLTEGATETLTATVKPDDATDKTVTWISSDEHVAIVEDGIITAVKPGTATIIASANDGSGVNVNCAITVLAEPKFEAVDLGLSVKWANMNLDAISPEEAGGFYAWGETEPKEKFFWNDYKWAHGSPDSLIKYNTDYKYGIVDNMLILTPEDDAAHMKLGGNWRMPTNEELEEIIDNCSWTSVQENGIRGYRVTSNKQGYTDKSIFLPATGLIEGTTLYNSYRVEIWSSSLQSDNSRYAIGFHLSNSFPGLQGYARAHGRAIRPVLGEEIKVIPVEEISLKSSISLSVGESTRIVPSIIPANATDKSVSWTSSDSSIASIDATGMVTANKIGIAVITCTSINGIKGVCTITVEEIAHLQMEYVDLGLSVKWGKWNLGSSYPEEIGDYYAWGEIKTKQNYSASTYKWCSGSFDSLTKYNNNSYFGIEDNKIVLDAEDDAAHMKLGGNWRIPTKAEQDELRQNCTWTWTEVNGIKGYKVTSKINGFTDQSIFLPATGDIQDSDHLNEGGGYYWSSSLDLEYPVRAHILSLRIDRVSYDQRFRVMGLPIRPVTE